MERCYLSPVTADQAAADLSHHPAPNGNNAKGETDDVAGPVHAIVQVSVDPMDGAWLTHDAAVVGFQSCAASDQLFTGIGGAFEGCSDDIVEPESTPESMASWGSYGRSTTSSQFRVRG